jgi:hypothetical protein
MMDNDSATSAVTEGTLNEIQKLQRLPRDVLDIVTKPVYHVVFDMDFGLFLHNKSEYVRGKDQVIRRMPVVFDLELARQIAGELIAEAISKGCVGDKKYPLLGAVIFGMKFANCDNVKCEDLTYDMDSKVSNKDITTYDIERNGKTVKQGSVSFDSLRRLCAVSAEYVVRNDLQPSNGFALLNMCPNLEASDIQMLKQMLNDSDKQVELKLCGVAPVIDTLQGQRNMEQAAQQEKAQHIVLKQNKNSSNAQPQPQNQVQDSHNSSRVQPQPQNQVQDSRNSSRVQPQPQNQVQDSRNSSRVQPQQTLSDQLRVQPQPQNQVQDSRNSSRVQPQQTLSDQLRVKVKESISRVDNNEQNTQNAQNAPNAPNVFLSKSQNPARPQPQIPRDIQKIIDEIHEDNNANMTGGQIDYAALAKQKKAEYKRLKAAH